MATELIVAVHDVGKLLAATDKLPDERRVGIGNCLFASLGIDRLQPPPR